MRRAYVQGRLFDGKSLQEGRALLTEAGKVTAIVMESEVPSSYELYPLDGDLLAPAFIDLQIYGGDGRMFSQDTEIDSLTSTYSYSKKGGAGYFMITLATNTIEKFLEALDVAKAYVQNGGRGLLGVHLEGPYLNPIKRGAHVEALIKKPTLEEVNRLLEQGRGIFKMITLAPECCDPELIRLLQDQGIIVSAGHSNATYQEATAAFDRGIPAATHLFNAMSPFQHRAPGMAGAILDHHNVRCSLVCDGIHVDYAAVRIAKAVMKERLFYITDAVAETAQGVYQHLLQGDRYCLPDGTLSGSALTMAQSVRNGIAHAGIPLEESLRMATSYPASFIQDRKIGVLEPGAEAGLVVLDASLQVKSVIES
ncbi:MAG: N-acetylglucosamine-6-phosphate deacetylase [Bacteroidota bacterium]